MHSSLLVPRRDDTLYRREFSLNFIAGGLRLRLAETDEEPLRGATAALSRLFW